ncbi:metal dependent phosphohydrolase [Candidatus Magnetoovum chiemensis]|nr:metal dependent phosphohydrolase [Candidatus Magnetoovum chiemensis]
MIKNIFAEDLKLGMFVILEDWLNHPFLTNKFIITSKQQIKKIIELGASSVKIDTEKGLDTMDAVELLGHGGDEVAAPKQLTSDIKKLVSDELKNALKDKKLHPKKKAEILYRSSLDIMGKLLESPTAQSISAAKDGIKDIVDVILSEDDTSLYLLTLTYHDFYTYTHSVNVGVLSVMLSKELFKNSTAHDMHELGAGFFLHDIGKVKVDASIINKPGRLTENEMFKMKTHPYQGYKLLQEADQLSQECKIIVMQHHEREDGTGYPMRLKGNEIHTYGRIGCIADVYDALTAERSYKPKLTPFEALKIMKEQMLNHFHKDVFDRFVLLFK